MAAGLAGGSARDVLSLMLGPDAQEQEAEEVVGSKLVGWPQTEFDDGEPEKDVQDLCMQTSACICVGCAGNNGKARLHVL